MKWTIEWAVMKYGAYKVLYPDTPHIDICLEIGEKQIIRDIKGEWSVFGEMKFFDSERAAVKWLVADQPRVEKKRKWVLEDEVVAVLVGNIYKTDIGLPNKDQKFVVTHQDDGIHIKQFKRSTPDEKAEK